jgi:hypothetical protein
MVIATALFLSIGWFWLLSQSIPFAGLFVTAICLAGWWYFVPRVSNKKFLILFWAALSAGALVAFFLAFWAGGTNIDWTNTLLPYWLLIPTLIVLIGASKTKTTRANRSHQRTLWITIGLAILVMALIWFFWFLSRRFIGEDEGSYLYEALLILQGKIPFRDFITRAPLVEYSLAGLVWLIHLQFVRTTDFLKMISLVFFAATGGLVYVIVRRFQSANVAAVATLAALASAPFFLTKLIFNDTTVSIPLILLVCYLLQGNLTAPSRKRLLCTGVVCGLAVLVRETSLLFAAGLCIYYIYENRWRDCFFFIAGLGAVLAGAIIFFSQYLGFVHAAGLILGFSHLVAAESPELASFSLRLAGLFLLSLVPFLGILVVYAPKRSSLTKIYPQCIWLAIMTIFYVAYAFKRGFLLSYGGEYIPVIVTAVFCSISSTDQPRLRGKELLVAIVLLVTSLLIPYAGISDRTSTSYNYFMPASGGVYFYSAMGSAIPLSSFEAASAVVRASWRPGDTILVGNLGFTLDNNLNQFMDISRLMAYEGPSTIYSLYNAPIAATVVADFKANPPTFVGLDDHLSASLWEPLAGFIEKNYLLKYTDGFIFLGVRRPAEAVNRTVQ